jgi:hypothetical protein
MNPYAPLPASQDQSFARAIIDPERREELEKQLENLNTLSFALCATGLLLQGVGRAMHSSGISLLGSALFVAGLVFYAKMRGLHGAWCLLGLLSYLGFLILNFLSKHCLNCNTRQPFGVRRCIHCDAPLGA